MSQVANPHKRFQFSIFLFGMNPFLAQKVTTADREHDVVEHGEGNHVIKTAGMVKFGNVVIEKISSNRANDLFLYAWSLLVNNEITGSGLLPQQYKKPFQIQKLHVDGKSPLDTWNYTGGWPCKINGTELDRLSSDNTIESVEFCIDREIRI